MHRAFRFFAILCLTSLCLSACDGGLDPTTLPKTARIYGTVTYSKGWPPLDSLEDIRVAAFKNIPERIEDVLGSIINGNAYYTAQSLDKRVSSSSYYIDVPNPPVTLKYIAVAQQFGKNISSDWRLIGVYTLPDKPDEPAGLTLRPGDMIRNVNIYVDFSKLPPQPFK